MLSVLSRLIRPSIFLILFLGAHSARSQSSILAQTDSTFHAAGVAEITGQLPEAVNLYNAAIIQSATLPLHIREWTRGTAGYLMARCAAHLFDSSLARNAILYALQHHMWNRDLATSDTVLRNVVGSAWLDSLFIVWSEIQEGERRFWHSQPNVVWTPQPSNQKHPLIIALHGGNASFERFAERWKDVANELSAVIVIPAGIERQTEVTNSWGHNISQFDERILNIIEEYSRRADVDSIRVYLAGFSQGAHGALEIALRHSGRIKGAVAFAGFISDTVSEASLATASKNGVRLYCISGELEEPLFKNSIITAVKDCQERGIDAKLELVPGMIHEVPLDFMTKMRKAWDWLTAKSSSASNR
jgi:predicted esterase